MSHFTVTQVPPSQHTIATASIDAVAVSVAGASFMGYLPSIAAVLSIVWLTMQIISTVDKWIHRKEYRRTFKIVPADDIED